MHWPLRPLRLSFQARVLIPVVSVMVLLVVVPMWILSRRMSRQLESGAAENLTTADAVFKKLQTIRAKNFLLRCRNAPNEPRFQAVAQKSDPKTLEFLLNELLDELGGDVVLFSNARAEPAARVSRSPQFDLDRLAIQSAEAVERAMSGQPNVETLSVSGRLFDVVSIPAGVGGNRVGVLTVGTELGSAVAQEFKQLTRSDIVLLANGQIAVATLSGPDLAAELLGPLRQKHRGPVGSPRSRSRPADTITVNGEHFMYLTGQFGEARPGPQLGYMLLSSYEKPLRAFQATQRTSLWIRIAGILFGTALVSVLVRRATRPLRQLRDSAEAVGRGDFSRRVEIRSSDECGELATVFNRMTGNLKTSREELERAVETLQSTQAQLIQSEKMRAIGTLAGGIAHDFNNILGAILGFGELVLDDVPAGTRAARNMGQVMKAGERAKDLVRQILAFSRQSDPQRVNVRLRAITEETLKLLRATLPATVQIQTRFNTDADTVVADPTQLHQVLMNFGTNASHAMREKGGVLTVTLDEFTIPLGGIADLAQLKPGPHLRLAVADTGHGMERAVIERIFDPFFTTKPVGEGTGLGLSVVHGIIRNHGGEITVTSQPGGGTTFSVYLPRAEANEAGEAPADEPVRGARERILVVDDEEPLVNMMQQKLTRLGYEVIAYHDSSEAWTAFQSAPHRFDLVITDLNMPQMTGADLAGKIFQLRSSLPVILCSGSGQALVKARSLRPAVRECVLKPLNFAELSRSIRRALDHQPNLEGKQP